MKISKFLNLFPIVFLLTCTTQSSYNRRPSSIPAISYDRDDFEILFNGRGSKMRINMPKVECPEELTSENICFHHHPHGRNTLVLDPGHFLDKLSLRNVYHNLVHEGYANMTVATLAWAMIRKCLPYQVKETADTDEGTKVTRSYGIRADRLFLSYYPGEKRYGEYYFPNSPGQKITWSGGGVNVQKEGGGFERVYPRYDHLNRLLNIGYDKNDQAPKDYPNPGFTSLENEDEKGVIISIHADAPDWFDMQRGESGLRKARQRRLEEYPFVLFRRARKNSLYLAMNIYESLTEKLAPFYSSDQRKEFVVKPADTNGVEHFQKLRQLGHPMEGDGVITDRVFPLGSVHRVPNSRKIKMKATQNDMVVILRAGREEGTKTPKENYVDISKILSNKRFNSGYSEQKFLNADFTPKFGSTEVVLTEGFAMDGANVGARIQRELSDYQLEEQVVYRDIYDARDRHKRKWRQAFLLLQPILVDENRPEDGYLLNPNPVHFINYEKSQGNGTYKTLEFNEYNSVITKTYDNGMRVNGDFDSSKKKADGLRVSSYYVEYAKAIVLGLQKRFACNAEFNPYQAQAP